MGPHKTAAYLLSCVLLCMGLLLAYVKHMPPVSATAQVPILTTVQGDLVVERGGKISMPSDVFMGPIIQAGTKLDSRSGIGIYPGQSVRMYAPRHGDLRFGFAQQDGGFRDAVVVNKDGDMGLGIEPSARLHVGGDLAVNGTVGIGPYVLSATNQGLQVCKQGGSCQYVFEDESTFIS